MKKIFTVLAAFCGSGFLAHGSIIFHLDANDLAGTLNDGDPVASWGGLSQGTATNQPTFRSGGMNGMPSVDFDGTDDILGGGTATGARSVVAVTLYEGNRSLATLISNDNDRLNIRRNASTTFHRSEGQGGDQNEFYRHGNHAGFDNLYVNGVGSGAYVPGDSHVIVSNAGAPANYTNFTIGRAAASGAAANRWWDGDVSEIYVFDQTLTTDEIVGVSSILAARWGSTAVSATPSQITAGNLVLGIIPEPQTINLVALGLLALLARKWK